MRKMLLKISVWALNVKPESDHKKFRKFWDCFEIQMVEIHDVFFFHYKRCKLIKGHVNWSNVIRSPNSKFHNHFAAHFERWKTLIQYFSLNTLIDTLVNPYLNFRGWHCIVSRKITENLLFRTLQFRRKLFKHAVFSTLRLHTDHRATAT